MLPSKKYLLIAIVTLATLLLGFVFSGYLTLLFLGLDTKLFTWNTYYQYSRARSRGRTAPAPLFQEHHHQGRTFARTPAG